MSYIWYRVSAYSSETRRPIPGRCVIRYSLDDANKQAAKWDAPNVLVVITPLYH